MYDSPYKIDYAKLGEKHKHSFKIAQTSFYLYAVRDVPNGWMVSLSIHLIRGNTCAMYYICDEDFERIYNATRMCLDRVLSELEVIEPELHSELSGIINKGNSGKQRALKPYA